MDLPEVKVEPPKERWSGKIREVVIGATREKGGTRSRDLRIGGENCLPYVHFEGQIPNPPAVGMEIWDIKPDFPPLLMEALGDVAEDPTKWAKRCEELGADFVTLKLMGTDPERAKRGAEEAVQTVEEVLKATGLPLFIYTYSSGAGGDPKRESEIIEKCAEAAQGERCFLGLTNEDNYKSFATAATAYGHGLVAFSNLDINLAKQMNIMLLDFGFDPQNIIMDPLFAGLGVGIEYAYSMCERIKLAALMGDNTLQMPMVGDLNRCWGTKEAYAIAPDWGDEQKRAVIWEAITGYSALVTGANLLVVRHPETVKLLKDAIKELMGGG
jgi:acetyl-CoA decarbonylase/synthase complex subunit delta